MRYLVGMLATIGLLFIILILAIGFGASRFRAAGQIATHVTDGTILTLTIDGPFAEETQLPHGLSAVLAARQTRLRDIIRSLDGAAADKRVRGLLLKLDGSPGLAQAQELRAALAHFRAAGKFVDAFADDFGQSSPGDGQYYLASACDQIWMQPMGEMMLSPASFELMFFKDALAKLDIDPEFFKRSDYKTAPEAYTERGFTGPAREMMEGLANDATLQLVTDIAASRKLPADQIRAMFDRGPIGPQDAVDAKFIDHVGYADELVRTAKDSVGDKAHLIAMGDYLAQLKRTTAGNAEIALIYQVGEINRVVGSIDPSVGVRGDPKENSVIRGFYRAIQNPSIKTILFRIDSPGGSVSGSESLRRLVVQAKERGKKVVVSMGAMAASGGYWIAADADKIVADPGTLTGSIGVFTGKFVFGKALADIGITTDHTADGPFSGMESPFRPFSPEQGQRLNVTLDRIYDGFLARVSDGRKIPVGTVAQSAKGRVWTGQQAKQLGLVDELGGLTDALRVARELGGLPADAGYAIYPEPLTPFEIAHGILDGGLDINGAISVAADRVDGPIGVILRKIVTLLHEGDDARLLMPDIDIGL